FDPEKSKITLTEIPPETEVTIGTRTDTLNGQYEYAGSDNAKLGVSNVLFSPVNRYVRVDRKGAENIIDAFGGLEKQLQTPLKQGELSLSAGNHLLSGEILYQWMSLPASDSYPSKIMWLRDLLENRLTADLQTRGEYLFTAFLNNSDTDISQFDFVQRKKALRYYLNHPDKCVDIQILSGIWSADRSVFYPDTSKRSPN
ncbi:MAG: LCP family protein, partial [Oscillospiraceae bacterium]